MCQTRRPFTQTDEKVFSMLLINTCLLFPFQQCFNTFGNGARLYMLCRRSSKRNTKIFELKLRRLLASVLNHEQLDQRTWLSEFLLTWKGIDLLFLSVGQAIGALLASSASLLVGYGSTIVWKNICNVKTVQTVCSFFLRSFWCSEKSGKAQLNHNLLKFYSAAAFWFFAIKRLLNLHIFNVLPNV